MITSEIVYDALSKCFDPEIPIVSIVELGLIYDVAINGSTVEIAMTLTAPGCPMSSQIAQDAKSKLLAVDGIDEAIVNIVWEPQWTPDRLSDSAKKKMGFNQ